MDLMGIRKNENMARKISMMILLLFSLLCDDTWAAVQQKQKHSVKKRQADYGPTYYGVDGKKSISNFIVKFYIFINIMPCYVDREVLEFTAQIQSHVNHILT